MKKITNLSIIVSLSLCSCLYANTLEEAFTNSKVSGELKAQYFDKQDPGDGKNDTISVVGGNLGIVTDSFYGFTAGATFQATQTVSRDIKGANNFLGTMDASGAVLSESYLTYSLANTTGKLGRQYVTTPLLAGSGSRMIKESFEGVLITNTDLADTTLLAGYLNKFQSRTDGAENPGKFANIEDGAYTIYAKNNSIKDLKLQAQYLNIDGIVNANDKDVFYFDAAYNAGFAVLEAQVLDSSNGNVDGTMYGLRASGNIAMVNVTGIYTTTTDDGQVYPGVGNGADSAFTALPVHGGLVTYMANTDTMVAVLASKVADATLAVYVGQVKSPDYNNLGGSDQVDAYGGFVEYAFNKNLSAKVMYENAKFSHTLNDSNALRVYTSYKF